MEELLSMLDSSVFTDEIKDKIKQEFDKAVELAVEVKVAQEKADSELDDQDELGDLGDKDKSSDDDDYDDDYEGDEAILNTMTKKEIVEKAERFLNQEINKVTAKAEQYGKYIAESMTKKAEEYAKYVVESHTKADEARIDTYLNTVVDSIVEGYAKENAELKVNIAKADVLVEGFQSMLTTGGVYLKDIITESEKVAKPDLSIELDAKIMENKTLKDQINGFKREQVLAKLTEGLTAPQKDSVLKIQKHLNFINEEKFTAQLSQIVETAKVKPDIKESSKINENKSVSTGLTSDTHQRFF